VLIVFFSHTHACRFNTPTHMIGKKTLRVDLTRINT
jgi:hypothetical protein